LMIKKEHVCIWIHMYIYDKILQDINEKLFGLLLCIYMYK